MTTDARQPAHERGYDTTWRRLRSWWLRQHPLCVMCEQMGVVAPADVVDHINPFHGKHDPLRIDVENLQSLCAAHHNSAKQRQDKTGCVAGADISGRPIDPNHHWNA